MPTAFSNIPLILGGCNEYIDLEDTDLEDTDLEDTDLEDEDIFRITLAEELFVEYRPGGYHPVTLGDRFKDGRYEVLNKLGWGRTCTVWLVWDYENGRLVVLKILVSKVTKPTERRILEHLNQKAGRKPSDYNIAQILDAFVHEGPNGSHHCLVTNLVGPSIGLMLGKEFWQRAKARKPLEAEAEAKEEAEAEAGEQGKTKVDEQEEDEEEVDGEVFFQTKSTVEIMQQLVKAVEFTHEAGICRADIRMSHVTVLPVGFWSAAGVHDIERMIGKPEGCPSYEEPENKGAPKYIYRAARWKSFKRFLYQSMKRGKPPHLNACLIGFGQSFFQGQEPESFCPNYTIRAPEVLLTGKFDYRADTWYLGNIFKMYRLLTKSMPWNLLGLSPYSLFGYEKIMNMTFFMEAFPEEWVPNLEKLRLRWQRKLIPKDVARPRYLGKKGMLDVELGFGNPRHEPAIAIIRGMMRLLPSDRSTLKETGDMLEEMAMFLDHEEWDENFFEGYQNWNGPDDLNDLGWAEDSDVEDEERSARTLCPSLESLTVESSEGCDAASSGKSDVMVCYHQHVCFPCVCVFAYFACSVL